MLSAVQTTVTARLMARNKVIRSISSHGIRTLSTRPPERPSLPHYAKSGVRTATSDANDGAGAYEKVAFIGTGKMAEAMIHPLIETNLQPAHKICVYDVNVDIMKSITSKYEGLVPANSLQEVVDGADLVICAVKPQNINDAFFAQLRKAENLRIDDGTFLSIAAGVPLSYYYESGFQQIVRSMPNTPAQIGRGITVWTCTESLGLEERDRIQTVLGCLGKAMYVDSELQVDMSTSISGSGPAYIFMLMEAMIDAGVHMGFPREKATTLVYHTLLGSTLYAMETGEHPAVLRNSVTSPSGTTASALYELENGRFRTVIKDAMWACYRRSLEMGGHGSNVGPGRNNTTGSESNK